MLEVPACAVAPTVLELLSKLLHLHVCIYMFALCLFIW